MGKPSALFVDRTYVEQQLATLRSDIITVLEAKFRVVQNDQSGLYGCWRMDAVSIMQMRNHKCLRRIPGRLKCAAG